MQLASSWVPKVVRKCESKHWFSCGADGRAGGRAVYGHVITTFSGMGRFTKLWGFARAWSSATKKNVSCKSTADEVSFEW